MVTDYPGSRMQQMLPSLAKNRCPAMHESLTGAVLYLVNLLDKLSFCAKRQPFADSLLTGLFCKL